MSQSSVTVTKTQSERAQLSVCVCVCVELMSSQPRYNYMETCSVWLHLSGTYHIHLAVIAIVTKKPLFEHYSSNDSTLPKPTSSDLLIDQKGSDCVRQCQYTCMCACKLISSIPGHSMGGGVGRETGNERGEGADLREEEKKSEREHTVQECNAVARWSRAGALKQRCF